MMKHLIFNESAESIIIKQDIKIVFIKVVPNLYRKLSHEMVTSIVMIKKFYIARLVTCLLLFLAWINTYFSFVFSQITRLCSLNV